SPQIAWTSPAGAISETSRSAWTPPKFLAMWRISSRCGSTWRLAIGVSAFSAGLGPWLMGRLIRQGHRVMDLPGDLDEPDRRVQVPADRVLLEGLDLRHRHPDGAEVRQGVLDQPAPQATAARASRHGQVVDPADAGLGVALHRDIADHL